MMGTRLFLLTIACTMHKMWNYVKYAYSSSYNLCAQCIKLFDYEECGYFVDLNY